MEWSRITIIFFLTFLSYFTGAEKVDRCSILSATDFTSRNLEIVQCNRRAVSRTCEIPCQNGFIVKNEEDQEKNFTTITCKRKAQGVFEWDGFETCVAISVSCPITPPGLASQHISNIFCKNVTLGSTCTVTCQPGFRPTGQPLTQDVRCRKNGLWTKPPKTCLEITCPSSLPLIRQDQHLRSALDVQCGKSIGAHCEVLCEQGYEDQSSPTTDITCTLMSNNLFGIWVGYKSKTCTPKECKPLQRIADASNDCSNVRFNSRCRITCNAGYEFSNGVWSKQMTCQLINNKVVWKLGIDRIGTCQAKRCKPLQQIAGATNDCSNVRFDSRCRITCNDGYEFSNGASSKQMTCQLANNKVVWKPGIDIIGTCQAKECRPLQRIADATNNCSNVRFGSSCQITCNDGYEFSRSKSTQTMMCGLNRNQVVLEPTTGATIGECRRKTCALPQLSYLAVTCSNIPFDSPCEIRCQTGYKFSSGELTKQITCKLIRSQLVWIPRIDGIGTCERIKCPQITTTNFGTPPAGAYLPLGFGTCRLISGSTCSLSCPGGYAFGGKASAIVSCNEALQAWKPSIQDVGFCTVKIVGNKNCEYWFSGTMSSGTKDAESQCKEIFGKKSVLAMPKTSEERNYANSAVSYLVGASNVDGSASWDDGDNIHEVINGAGNCTTLRSNRLRAYDCSYSRKFICERPTVSYNRCLANPCKSGGICIPYGCSFKCQCEPNFFGYTCEKGPFDISIETPKPIIARGESISISYNVKSNAGKAGFTLYVNGEKQREVQDITNKWKSGSYTAKGLTNDIYISGKALLEAQPDSPVYKCIKVTVQNADEAVNITKDVCDGTVFDITWKGLGTVATSSISYDIFLDDKLQGNSSSTRYKLQGLTTGTNYDIKVVPHLQGCTNKELFKVHKRRTSMGPPNPSSVHLPEANDRSILNCTITWSNDRPKSIGGFKINIIEKMKGYSPELVASEQNFFEEDVDEMEYSYPTNPNSIYEVMVGTKPQRVCGNVPVWSNRTFGCRTDSEPPKEVRVPMTVVPNSDRGTVSMELSSVDERNGQVSCYLVIVQKMDSSFASENSTSEPITDIDQLVQANQTIRDGDSFVTLALPRFEGSTDLILGDGRMTCCDMSNSSMNCDQERTRTRRAIGTVVHGENRQLDPDANYRHYIVVSTPTANKDNVLMASPMSHPWSLDGGDRGNNILVIALPVIFAILLVLVLVAIIIVRRKNTKGKVHAVPADHALMQIQRRPNQEEAIIDVDVPGLNLDDIVERHLSTHSFQLANLYQTIENKRADEDMLFLEEFKDDINKMIAQCKLTSDISQLPANRTTKNRYKNIVPYDNSRVVLEKTHGNEFSDFINAAYIDGYKYPGKFIATQGPQPQTIADFWRMVWEQECYIITVLTNLIEKKKVKCAQYWPEEEATSKKYDSINVTFMETTTYGDYVRRKFEVSRDGKTRTIFQFHFIAWPDHGIPNTTSSILRFHKSVIYSQPSSAGPIIVHCSAGVGRTGTFIALDILSEQISETEEINICALVGKMRTKRPEMVQTLDQYIYIHKLVLELYQFGETDVEVSGFNAAYNNLRRINGQRSEIEQEFAMLDYFLPIDTDHETAQKQINKHLNRNSAVLPYDHNAVFIQMTPTDRTVPYYNASEIASYHANDKFIAAQTPDENSIEMFWRTVFDNHVSMIVSLCETKEEANYCYWPKRSVVVKHGSVSVRTIEEATDMGCVERKFEIASKDQKISVTQICYGNWAENVVPASSGIVLEIFARVEKHHQTLGNSEKKTTLVHCSDGSGRSGTFCAISNLIERLKNENRVDVFRIVKDLRDQRPKMVQSLEQYEFCYQAVNEFLQSFDLYGNFQ